MWDPRVFPYVVRTKIGEKKATGNALAFCINPRYSAISIPRYQFRQRDTRVKRRFQVDAAAPRFRFSVTRGKKNEQSPD